MRLLTAMLLASATIADLPVSDDDSIKIELFAEAPQLVTPTGIAVDNAGRVFVAESHTHFRPDDYDGPPTDRILVLQDTNGDGRADERTVFHAGFTHVMDLEFNRDGGLYVATRRDIHRLKDRDGDGRADEVTPILKMDTTGTYPHNGISGLCFNVDGTLNFGLGENLGHDYTLIGADGMRISGGGEGGSTYRLNADGSKLRRVTTGWWNPWGMCVDSRGRIFGTDNDPGASPPCRLIQIHEGADYGYEYRYGRTGLHPLISWTGGLPGTMPMVAGTGEAPCGIISCETTNLPPHYRNHLLVASWADHQIEAYEITQPHDSGQVKANRRGFIVGPNDFRPVGLAIAPNGDIYVSDWVSASYQLHGKGRVWRIRGQYPDGLDTVRVAESAKRLLGPAPEGTPDIAQSVRDVRSRLQNGYINEPDLDNWLSADTPTAVRAEVTYHLSLQNHRDELMASADSSDPLLRHAAIHALSRQTETDEFEILARSLHAAVLLAMKRSELRDVHAASGVLERALDSRDDDVWAVAVKWIADDMLTDYRGILNRELKRTSLTVPQYLMLSAAIDRLDAKQPADIPSEKQLVATALNSSHSVALRSAALRLLNPDSRSLQLASILELSRHKNARIRVEAIRQLAGRAGNSVEARLLELAMTESDLPAARLEAIAALAPVAATVREELLELAEVNSSRVAAAALRSLAGVKITDDEAAHLSRHTSDESERSQQVRRVLGEVFARPSATDTEAWLALLDKKGDPTAGQRIFSHRAIATCGRCHQHSGRGNSVGPSLSLIARRLPADAVAAKRWLLETILQPSRDMAPQYTPWIIVTTDGRQLIGLPRRKGGSQEAYLGEDGKEFVVQKPQIEFHQESRTSLMPEGLLQTLTVQELRDLFAFLLASNGEGPR